MKYSLFAVVLLLIGCGAQQYCLKVGGEYQGKAGEVEFCYQPDNSKEQGTPVLKGEDGQNLIAISADDLDSIAEKLEELKSLKTPKGEVGKLELPVSAKKSAFPANLPVYKRIQRLIR